MRGAGTPPGRRVAAGSSRTSRPDWSRCTRSEGERRCGRRARRCSADRHRPALLDSLQLEFGDQRQDPDREPPHRRRPVEVVLHRDQPAPASFRRLIDSSASTAERANRQASRPRSRPSRPARNAPSASWNIGRAACSGLIDLFPPLDDLTSCNFAQSAIFFRCTSGEINDSPSRPPRRETLNSRRPPRLFPPPSSSR